MPWNLLLLYVYFINYDTNLGLHAIQLTGKLTGILAYVIFLRLICFFFFTWFLELICWCPISQSIFEYIFLQNIKKNPNWINNIWYYLDWVLTIDFYSSTDYFIVIIKMNIVRVKEHLLNKLGGLQLTWDQKVQNSIQINTGDNMMWLAVII